MAELGLISQAFIVPDGEFGERVRRVLALIDGVHRVGSLPRIPIVERRLLSGADGQYVFHRHRGQAQHIIVSPTARRPELTILHEIGHLLDHQALGIPGSFASRRHPAMADWRQSIEASHAYAQIGESRWVGILSGLVMRDFDYLLAIDELWARSYAQYVAASSGDSLLAAQVAMARADPSPYHLSHWEAADFEPIRAAIDRVLAKKGWLE